MHKDTCLPLAGIALVRGRGHDWSSTLVRCPASTRAAAQHGSSHRCQDAPLAERDAFLGRLAETHANAALRPSLASCLAYEPADLALVALAQRQTTARFAFIRIDRPSSRAELRALAYAVKQGQCANLLATHFTKPEQAPYRRFLQRPPLRRCDRASAASHDSATQGARRPVVLTAAGARRWVSIASVPALFPREARCIAMALVLDGEVPKLGSGSLNPRPGGPTMPDRTRFVPSLAVRIATRVLLSTLVVGVLGATSPAAWADMAAAKAALLAKNYPVAAEQYRVEALRGNAVAARQLGMLYVRGWGTEVNFEWARSLLEQASEGGDAVAAGELALYHLKGGIGYARDLKKGYDYALKGALGGSPVAQRALGALLRHTAVDGVPKPDEAVKWYRLAAEQGDMDAQSELAECLQFGVGNKADPTEAILWFEKAATQGDERATAWMAWAHWSGSNGLAANKSKGLSLAEQMAPPKYYALLVLAQAYWFGEGVAADKAKAAQYAKQGLAYGYAGTEYIYRLATQEGVVSASKPNGSATNP